VIPGAFQRERTQRGDEGLGPAPGEACLGAARAGQVRALLVAMVGVESLGDDLAHELQCHPSGFGLDGLEVVECAGADQPFDLGLDLLRNRRVQTPLFPGVAGRSASSFASHIRALTSTNSRTSARSRWCSSSWTRVRSMASAGMVRPRVLPVSLSNQVNNQ